ncbi:hypothetical protein ACHAP8_006683 [Fusarium lateritium]
MISRLAPCLTGQCVSSVLSLQKSIAPFVRWSSSGSRWKQRQGRDSYARGAKVQGLKSRAAFKLLEVAVERTRPNGRVIGIDLIPAQPPRGVATFQGDFLSSDVQEMVKNFILESHRRPPPLQDNSEAEQSSPDEAAALDRPSYLDMERHAAQDEVQLLESEASKKRIVDVVLSDMSAPWDQTTGFNVNTLSNPYHRLMNTSGNAFRDHAGSMDLCAAALQFASDTLRSGGHFVCKFYQGSEDKDFEKKLKMLFSKESREAYFIGLRRKPNITIQSSTGTQDETAKAGAGV